MFLCPDDYDIWHYSSRVLHAHYIHVIVYIHDLISYDLVLCTLAGISPVSLYYHQIYYSFIPVLYLYCPLLSHFHIIASSSLVCTCWSASNGPWFFSIRAWGDWRAHSKEPRKITRRESDVSCLMYFGILSCYHVPMPKLYLLLFLLCYVSNVVSKQKLL